MIQLTFCIYSCILNVQQLILLISHCANLSVTRKYFVTQYMNSEALFFIYINVINTYENVIYDYLNQGTPQTNKLKYNFDEKFIDLSHNLLPLFHHYSPFRLLFVLSIPFFTLSNNMLYFQK